MIIKEEVRSALLELLQGSEVARSPFLRAGEYASTSATGKKAMTVFIGGSAPRTPLYTLSEALEQKPLSLGDGTSSDDDIYGFIGTIVRADNCTKKDGNPGGKIRFQTSQGQIVLCFTIGTNAANMVMPLLYALQQSEHPKTLEVALRFSRGEKKATVVFVSVYARSGESFDRVSVEGSPLDRVLGDRDSLMEVQKEAIDAISALL